MTQSTTDTGPGQRSAARVKHQMGPPQGRGITNLVARTAAMPSAQAGRTRLANALSAAAWGLGLEVETTVEMLRDAHGLRLAERACAALAFDPALLASPHAASCLEAFSLLARDIPELDPEVDRLRKQLVADSALVASTHAQPLRAWRVWPPGSERAPGGVAVPLGLEHAIEPRPIESLVLLGGELLAATPDGAPHLVVGWRIELTHFTALLALTRLGTTAAERLLEAIDQAQLAIGRVGDKLPEPSLWEAVADELLLASLADNSR